MTAKEMFEEMGFEIEQNNERYLIYTQVINHDDYDDVEINKVIFDKRQYLVSSKNQDHYIPISFYVLQAISKQIEELVEINDKEIKINDNSIQIGNKICYCVDKDLINYITELQDDNITLVKNQINSNSEHFRIVKENKRKIDNLRKQNKELKSDIEVLKRVKDFYKRHSLKYYRRCDVALAWIETTKEIIEQQPTEDDTWILDKLNSFENILNGCDEK